MSDDTAAITDLLDRWAEAELSGDHEAIGTFLAADFLGIGPFGFTLTREEWLQRHASGDLGYTQYKLLDTTVRQYGDAAIAVGIQDQAATYQGNPVPMSKLRYSATLVRVGGDWVIAGLQMSQLGAPQGGTGGRPPGR
ncbi:nuclear transport factor 2 family protein [Actinophytocola sp.]|uniref:nuclear transport factor 2 family protein n=1 Tax=Actinophytocola sp. TaxID=1872138 RepID=UPI00389AA1CC